MTQPLGSDRSPVAGVASTPPSVGQHDASIRRAVYAALRARQAGDGHEVEAAQAYALPTPILSTQPMTEVRMTPDQTPGPAVTGGSQPVGANQLGAIPPSPYGEPQPTLEEGNQEASALDDSLVTAMVVYTPLSSVGQCNATAEGGPQPARASAQAATLHPQPQTASASKAVHLGRKGELGDIPLPKEVARQPNSHMERTIRRRWDAALQLFAMGGVGELMCESIARERNLHPDDPKVRGSAATKIYRAAGQTRIDSARLALRDLATFEGVRHDG
jgi:hypothetical protein